MIRSTILTESSSRLLLSGSSLTRSLLEDFYEDLSDLLAHAVVVLWVMLSFFICQRLLKEYPRVVTKYHQ